MFKKNKHPKYWCDNRPPKDIDVIVDIMNILDIITSEERVQLEALINKYKSNTLRKELTAFDSTDPKVLLREMDKVMISKEPKPPSLITDINKFLIKPNPSPIVSVNESKYKP